MNLEKVFSFDDDIFPWVVERVKKTFRKKDVLPDVDAIRKSCNAHIVGQVDDDVLLFTWVEFKADGTNVPQGAVVQKQSGKEMTHFCLYNLITKKPSTIFDLDRPVDVVTASVNEEKTLLAFTVIEFNPRDCNPAEETVGTYQSLIAEISPKNRVFKLAVDQPHYQQVQFLHGKYPMYGSGFRQSHMFFFHHTKSIDLYHIPLARIGDGMVMSNQPEVENVVKRFVWAQYDRHSKRLYYVYSESEDDDLQEGLIFSAIQFCETSPRVVTMKMKCPFSICSSSNTRLQYDRKPLSKCISESNVNMQVVSFHDGSFFLCYQHLSTENSRVQTQESIEDTDTDDGYRENESQQSALEYSIFMLHHGSILRCKVPNVVPEGLLDQARLLFIMFNDCIAVILPGYIFHLLDCNAEHPPCHHLFLSGPVSEELPTSDQQLSNFTYFNSPNCFKQDGLQLFEPTLCQLFKLVVKNNYWTDCFFSTHCDTTRLALLHFSILHIQDPDLILQIFSHLARDPANPECVDILKEYLIGSTYFQMKFQVEATVYKLLPFSNTEPFRGHLETNRKGEKIARVSYTPWKTDQIFSRTFKDQKRKELEFWIILRQNVSFTTSVERFSLKKVSKLESRRHVNVSSTADSSFSSRFQRFRRMHSVESRKQTNPEEYKPEYLELIECDQATIVNEEKRSMEVLQSLTRYLHHYLPPEVPKMKIQKFAIEYITCQKKQSSKLLELFWLGLNYTEDTHPYDHSLNTRGTSRERALLMMFERYYMTVNEIHFPIPTGFHTFFVFMGFRCLEERLFIRYVTNKVFSLETEFMYRLLNDIGNDESYSHLISRLISTFDQPNALHFLKKWDSPGTSSRILCQRYVSNMLTEDTQFQSDSKDFLTKSQRFDEFQKTVSSLKRSGSMENQELETVSFRPLLNVIAALKITATQSKRPSMWRGNKQDDESRTSDELSFVSKNAMEHTTREIEDTLGLGTF